MSGILLIGATGMVGSAVLAARGSRPILSLARTALDQPEASLIAPSAQWPGIIAQEAPEVLICCLGTTIKSAGSRAAFRAVDHDLVFGCARAAKDAGARHLIVVSSVGAKPESSNFYLRTKAEMEGALRGLDVERLDIMRPGLLVGDRRGPARPAEALAMRAAALTDLMLQGPLRRYRSIRADMVARAIVHLAQAGGSGTHVHEHDAIRRLAD